MTATIIKDIVRQLEAVGYPVVGIVSDMGGSNQGVWRELNITPDSPYFVNPYDQNRNVYYFADVPHLIKLLRNHFIDDRLEVVDMGVIEKKIIEDLLLLESKNELKIAHKLSHHHLTVKGSQRQRVWPATQLFSNTTAKAIQWLGEKDLLKGNWENTSKVFKIVNDWFDTMNSCDYYGKNENCNVFGINLGHQIKVLEDMNKLTQSISTGKNKTKALTRDESVLTGKKTSISKKTTKSLLFCHFKLAY